MTATAAEMGAEPIAERVGRVEEIHRRSQRWRLMDCNEPTLLRMSASLSKEMALLEQQLDDADAIFYQYIEVGNSLDAEQVQEAIHEMAAKWERLRKRLKEVEEALKERRLRKRLIDSLGSEIRLNLLDGLVLVSILIVVAMTMVEMVVPLSTQVIEILTLVDTSICVILIGDFLLRLGMSGDAWWYLRRYWIDLVSSIPFYGILRFGRLVRIARFARLLRLLRLSRALRLLLFIFRGLDKLLKTFEMNLLKRSILVALVLLVLGALSIHGLEGVQDERVGSLSESLWWSFATVVTGGFADLYNPTTPTGRVVTVGMVLLGLTVTGIFTASLTSVLVEDESARLKQNQRRFEDQLEAMAHKLDLLSGETSDAFVALETVAQAISNQASREVLAEMLVERLTTDLSCWQASVHLLSAAESKLVRIAQAGLAALTPPERISLGEGFVGQVALDLHRGDITAIDLEPHSEICLDVQGVRMVCPLAAGRRFLGVVHIVLPKKLADDYIYTRAPMTLAHYVALAFYTAELATG